MRAGEDSGQQTSSIRHGGRLAIAAVAIVAHLLIRYGLGWKQVVASDVPLIAALPIGAPPFLIELSGNLIRRQFGSDMLAGLSIATSVILGEYLAGVIVVLMLSGG
jgi:hypothetical protein